MSSLSPCFASAGGTTPPAPREAHDSASSHVEGYPRLDAAADVLSTITWMGAPDARRLAFGGMS
ncbi:hypothetical protein BH23ACT5_BH23ACT5_06980 [soil metagenome]